MTRPCCVWTYFPLFRSTRAVTTFAADVSKTCFIPASEITLFLSTCNKLRGRSEICLLCQKFVYIKEKKYFVGKILFWLHHISHSSWEHVLESGSVRVNRHPESLGGSWVVFNSSKKELEWIIADPHPEFWRDGGGKHVLLHHALPG